MSKEGFYFRSEKFIVGTSMMTFEDIGKYIILLATMNQKGRLTMPQMLHIIRATEMSEELKGKFTPDAQGKHYNVRLEYEEANPPALTKSKLKQRPTTTTSPPVNHEIVYPFASEEFKSVWALWLKYRKEIGKPYKGTISEQAALQKMSEYPEQQAIKIIKDSMGNSYQGLIDTSNSVRANAQRPAKPTVSELVNTVEQAKMHFKNNSDDATGQGK